MSAYQKNDGKWYFILNTYNPSTKRNDIEQTFGPYETRDQAEVDEANADAMLQG